MLKKYVFLFFLFSCSSLKLPQTQVTYIHGAHFNSKSWNELRDELGIKNSVAVNLPGRGNLEDYSFIDLNLMSLSLCDQLSLYEAEHVLIAHSQAGAVVNNMLSLCPSLKIKKIIYVSAVIPFPGEKPFDLLSKADERNYFQSVKLNKKKKLLEVNDHEKFLEFFAPEALEEKDLREEVLKSLTSEPANISQDLVQYSLSVLNSIKKYYVFTTQDKIVSLESQKKTASRFRFEKTFQIESGHLPMITHTDRLEDIIEEILKN